jgi:hypothetical protein
MSNSWNPLAYKPSEVFKAIVGFLAPALVFLGGAVLADSDGGTAITSSEWLQALIAAVVTSAGVFAAGNKSVNPPPNPEGGFIGGGLLAVLGVVLIVVGFLGLFHVIGLSLAVSIVLIVIGLVLVVVSRGDL